MTGKNRVTGERVFSQKALILAVCLALLWVGFPAGSGGAVEGDYVIGPEDVLAVTIFAGGKIEEELEISVSSNGTINFPFLGEIKVNNLTVPKLVEKVTEPLARDYYVDPQVIIRIKEYKSRRIYVTGAVNKPGLYPQTLGMTLLEAIAEAGGLTQERGHYAFILKGSIEEATQDTGIDRLVERKQSIKIDLRELMDQGRADKNVRLEAGDVVYVQPSSFSAVTQHKVYVLGRVKQPGAYQYQEGLTALDACVLAGGFDTYAAPNRTIITRRSQDGQETTIKVDLNRVKEGKEKDTQVQPGDRIYVPKSWF